MPTADGVGWNATGDAGAVAAGGADAVRAGIGVLAAGGNAADAAVATILALQVTDHGHCCIGGEVPLLIYETSSRSVRALSGMGSAPLSDEAIDWYLSNGIPGPGDMRMAPVPSVVDLCTTTLQRFGTIALEEAVAPTLEILDRGEREWEPKLAATLLKLVEAEARMTGSRQDKLQAASDRFYGRGGGSDVADDLEADYIEHGSFLRVRDLQAHRTRIEDPITASYRGFDVFKCDTWTVGASLLQALNLLKGFDVAAMGHGSADYVHVITEALKLAMADRDEYYGDPEFVDVPLRELLSAEYTELRRPLIDRSTASSAARPGDPIAMHAVKHETVFHQAPGGTTTCVVADRWGNVVAATPSANVDSTRTDGGKTGVTYGNRLRSFNTTPGHPNRIQAGKRPRITLTPSLVLRDGAPVYAVSVAGGDRQDQVTLQLLLGAIDFGLSPSEAVTAPRFCTHFHQDSFDPNPDRLRTVKNGGAIEVAASVEEPTRAELRGRGHRVRSKDGAIGNPVMMEFAAGKTLAAGDPAARRHAATL